MSVTGSDGYQLDVGKLETVVRDVISGRIDDPDVVQGRPPAELPEPPPSSEIWEAAPINEEQRRNLVGLIPSAQRPRVIVRWGDARDLLVSGLLDGGDEIAQHAAVSTHLSSAVTSSYSR